MNLAFFGENDPTLTASWGHEIFTQVLEMYLMLVPSMVLRFDPPFSVCTPLMCPLPLLAISSITSQILILKKGKRVN